MKTGKIRALIVGGVAILAISSWITFQYRASTTPARVPDAIADKLLFAPYAFTKIPKPYTINHSSYNVKEGALLFSLQEPQGKIISISEQAVPKDFDVTAFYESTFKNPTRLREAKFETIFGQRQAQEGTLIGITTSDSTWILITSQESLSVSEARDISNSLQKQ